jgi:ABC-2 type transport system permease protein
MNRPFNTGLWLIRREFWESPSIWIVPLVIGGLLLLGALFGRVDITLPARAGSSGGVLLFVFGIAFVLIMSIYSTWYLLDCLYAERKDRSILFWKSLPVSDAQAVLSKLATGVLVIPLVYFVIADVTTLLIAFIVSVRARMLLGGALWNMDLWLQLQALWLYLIVTVAVWYLPVAAWLMLVSAWASRAVWLWSIMPPLGLYLAEHWLLGTDVVGPLLRHRLFGYLHEAFHSLPGGLLPAPPASVWDVVNPGGFFSSAAAWAGAAVGIALMFVVIQVRHRRTEL